MPGDRPCVAGKARSLWRKRLLLSINYVGDGLWAALDVRTVLKRGSRKRAGEDRETAHRVLVGMREDCYHGLGISRHGQKGTAMHVTTTATAHIVYPESDGKPMGETDIHIDALIYLREALKDYFREASQVYVAGNMLFYYEEDNPAACVAPDVFVVQGVAKHERRVYKLWEEGQPPAVVFEITSRSTRLDDTGTKRALYAMLGVREYFLYDPLGEYLRPALQGYRLQEGEYQRLRPVAPETFTSEVLGLELRLEDGRLRVRHPVTGERLLTPAEAQVARRAAEARVSQEAAARQVAEARVAAAEAELQRMRAELERLRRES